MTAAVDIVIPTIGRASLCDLLDSLAASIGPSIGRIIIVDDRRDADAALAVVAPTAAVRERIVHVRGAARGPAAARNAGWRRSSATWVAFLDDDVIADATWCTDLTADLAALSPDVGASQGRVTVPLPVGRRPTDWERNVAGLAGARYITADCAYRRASLVAVGGFDERFPRAFREDADLALRVIDRGWRIVAGRRRVSHPVRAAAASISIALQAGNADDVLMDAVHGPDWYDRAGAPRGAFASHVITVGCALTSVIAAGAWLASTSAFAWRRIAPGPRTGQEVRTMLATSVAIPFAAVAHRLRGYERLRAHRTTGGPRPTALARAVLFDRDGTLIEDVPYNDDPRRVRPMRGAGAALARLRAAGLRIGLVTNQSGIGLGTISPGQVAAVHARVDALLGPLDTIELCPHTASDACACRKPKPGMIERAAATLGVAPADCVVVGDIGSDIEAARAAGARAILVPTAVTRAAEIGAAPWVAPNLARAVDLILGGRA